MDKVKMPVDCICNFDTKGNLEPVRIRFGDTEGQHVVDIRKVLERDVKNCFGTMHSNSAKVHSFKCQSEVEGILIQYQLQFETKNCSWNMFI